MIARKKLLVTGAHGFVAGSLLAQAGRGWEVHAVSRGEALTRGADVNWHTCDPLKPDQLAEVFREAQPRAVIHTAALADIDFCQAHPEAGRTVNIGLTRSLVGLCGESGA